MIHSKKNSLVCGLLFLQILVTGGCIREDNSDCVRGLYIYFKPEKPKHHYPDLVRAVNLYFYDEAGDLAAGYVYHKDELLTSDKAVLVDDLPEGKYTLVSVINESECYGMDEVNHLTTLQSCLRNEVINHQLPDFFSGIRELTVERKSNRQQLVSDIFKHNNNIRLEIRSEGYDLPDGATFSTYIEGTNGGYHYYSATCPGEQIIKYYPHVVEPGENDILVRYDFTTMRLWRGADISLYLKEEASVSGVIRDIQLNIPDELAKVVDQHNQYLYDTDEKLSFTDEYVLVVTLGPEFILLELTINDWTVIGGGVNV